MPANLTPEYLAAEREYKSAHTQAEKVAALELMLATLPKHKGTEKLQADLRRRLSQARKESQKKGGTHAAPFYLIEKEGAGQVALIGPPNAGKSQLVAALTHAQPEVADYPFTTRFPTPGMMLFENVQIQLVDLPADLRRVHGALDPARGSQRQPGRPAGRRQRRRRARPDRVHRADPGAPPAATPQAAGRATSSTCPARTSNFAALQELYGDRYRYVGMSAATGAGLDRFARAVFDALDIVRVYTKAPGKKAELDAPFILRRGQTVQDAARLVHKDFAEHLKFARLFHLAGNREGLMVERTHVVQDQDILEFHI